ncbi:hypothetical protein Droror1_Dr00025320 [Drosera rotundifolia]
MYRKDCLHSIAKIFGKFLGSDKATLWRTRATGARLCVQVDANDNPMTSFEIEVGNKTLWQEVIYEARALYCNRCQKLGHAAHSCKIFDGEGNRIPREKPHVERPKQLGVWWVNEKELDLANALQTDPSRQKEKDKDIDPVFEPVRVHIGNPPHVALDSDDVEEILTDTENNIVVNKLVPLDAVSDYTRAEIPFNLQLGKISTNQAIANSESGEGLNGKENAVAEQVEETQ